MPKGADAWDTLLEGNRLRRQGYMKIVELVSPKDLDTVEYAKCTHLGETTERVVLSG